MLTVQADGTTLNKVELKMYTDYACSNELLCPSHCLGNCRKRNISEKTFPALVGLHNSEPTEAGA